MDPHWIHPSASPSPFKSLRVTPCNALGDMHSASRRGRRAFPFAFTPYVRQTKHPPDDPRCSNDLFTAPAGGRRGRAHWPSTGHPPYHPRGCTDLCGSRVRWASKTCSRAAPPPASKLPSDEPPGCNDLFTACVDGVRGRAHRMPSRHRPIPSRMVFRPPLGNLRDRRCGCDASFTCVSPRPSRIAHRPPSGPAFGPPSRTPSRSPSDHPRACISRVRRASPRRPRFASARILREYFASIGKLGTRSRRRRAR